MAHLKNYTKEPLTSFVMGGNLYSRGREFECQCWILNV